MNKVCAIVVTFQPDDALVARVAVLRDQVAHIVLVDNGSCSEPQARVASLKNEPKVTVIFNPENRGLAAALNQGVAWALHNGFRWIATFDQDSTVTPGFFSALLGAYAAFPDKEKVAIVSPQLWDAEAGLPHSPGRPCNSGDKLFAPVPTTITSGNLVPARTFERVGLYRDDFFIDYVDHEFCFRCRRHGLEIIEAKHAVLLHRIGEPTQHRLLWMRPVVTNHGAARRYYNTRNRLVVYRAELFRHPAWVCRDAWELLRDLAKLLLLETDRLAKVRAVLRGIFHALIGRMGRLPAL